MLRAKLADGTRAIERLTGSIGLADLTRRALVASGAVPGTQDWTIALAAANEGARGVVAKKSASVNRRRDSCRAAGLARTARHSSARLA